MTDVNVLCLGGPLNGWWRRIDLGRVTHDEVIHLMPPHPRVEPESPADGIVYPPRLTKKKEEPKPIAFPAYRLTRLTEYGAALVLVSVDQPPPDIDRAFGAVVEHKRKRGDFLPMELLAT